MTERSQERRSSVTAGCRGLLIIESVFRYGECGDRVPRRPDACHHTLMADDEEIHGMIEWYDKNCIKVNRTGAPNLVIYKPSIKYMFKEGERK